MDEVDRDNTLSTCIMLIPDATLRSQRSWVPEIHLTLGYFGRFEYGAPEVAEMVRRVTTMAANLRRFPIKGVANGTGIFPERERFAVVDLIDGIDLFYARDMLETVFGRLASKPNVDYTHGFTPHITRDYVDATGLQHDMVKPRPPIEFKFEAIGVWHGPNHYEIQL